MTKFRQVFLEMVTQNQEVFDSFKAIHDKYAQSPRLWQNTFNQKGEEIQAIIRKYENRLCGHTEGSAYNKFSANLAEKFQEEIRKAYPKIDCLGLEPPKFEIKKINLD